MCRTFASKKVQGATSMTPIGNCLPAIMYLGKTLCNKVKNNKVSPCQSLCFPL